MLYPLGSFNHSDGTGSINLSAGLAARSLHDDRAQLAKEGERGVNDVENVILVAEEVPRTVGCGSRVARISGVISV